MTMYQPIILHIETSTEVCSVALSRGKECVCVKESAQGRDHAGKLTVFIAQMLDANGISASKLDAVAVSSGPGSYTGLRIGLSVAKGLCYGADIPLLSVSTLQSMAMGFAAQSSIAAGALLCPMIDARRMEVYTALYDNAGKEVEKVSAKIISHQSFESWLDAGHVFFFGNGAEKCSSLITHQNAIFSEPFSHSAKYMIQKSLQLYNEKRFEDAAYFEPFYLKNFII